jgi:hypothetical protein
MNTRTLKTVLDCIGAVGLAVAGATAVPGFGIPPACIFYGLLAAGVCKAVSGQLSQVTGASDEQQGIAPAQVAAKDAVHDAAKTGAQVVTTTINSPTTTTTTKALPLIMLVTICSSLWLVQGCSTSEALQAGQANGAVVASADAAMQAWSGWVKTHPTTSAASILAVSNAYNVYYNSELVVSNLCVAYVTNPSTNISGLITLATRTVAASQTNLANIVNQLSK